MVQCLVWTGLVILGAQGKGYIPFSYATYPDSGKIIVLDRQKRHSGSLTFCSGSGRYLSYTIKRGHYAPETRAYTANQGLSDEETKQLNLFKDWAGEDEQSDFVFRPWIFQDVMGVTEAQFRQDIKWDEGKRDFSRYPILRRIREAAQRMKGRGFDATISTHLDDVAGELKDFPRRVALLGATMTLPMIQELIEYERQGRIDGGVPFEPGLALLDGYVLKDQGKLDQALEQTDITTLQFQNPDAVCQIASNLNCQEGGIGKKEAYVTGMLYASVQGEMARLSTLGLPIVCKYVLDPINLLEKLSDKVTVSPEGKITSFSQDFEVGDYKKIMVGMGVRVAVTSSYAKPFSTHLGNWNQAPKDRKDFLYGMKFIQAGRDPLFMFTTYHDVVGHPIYIDQVLTFALNVKGQAGAAHPQAAHEILKAAYAGTILIASLKTIALTRTGVLKAPVKVFLTLVGGGAFGNKITDIMAALNTEENRRLIARYGLDVRLVLYPDPRAGKGLSVEERGIIKSTIASMNEAIKREKLVIAGEKSPEKPVGGPGKEPAKKPEKPAGKPREEAGSDPVQSLADALRQLTR